MWRSASGVGLYGSTLHWLAPGWPCCSTSKQNGADDTLVALCPVYSLSHIVSPTPSFTGSIEWEAFPGDKGPNEGSL